jgi:Sugar phosphate permease
MNKKFLWTLSAGHTFTDMNQGALPAILPFLIVTGGISYTAAAGLVFAMALSSSIVQPLFGIWADKVSKPWLMPASILLAGSSLSIIGWTSNYWLMFTAAILSGVGIAAFHPEAARLANQAAGEKKGTGISIFSVGGNLGFAIGPAITTPAMLFFGLKGSIILIIPALLMSFILFMQVRKLQPQLSSTSKQTTPQETQKKDEWGKFSWLTLAIIARSIIFHSVNTFLPLFWFTVLLQTEAASGSILTIMFTVGAASSLLGGMLADRFGANNVIRMGFALLIPSLYFLITATNVTIATFLLFPTSFALFSIAGPLVLLGQKYLPNRMGFASGVTLGLAVSVGGLTAPLIGKYADIHGLVAAMSLLTFIPIFATFVVFTLKPPAN